MVMEPIQTVIMRLLNNYRTQATNVHLERRRLKIKELFTVVGIILVIIGLIFFIGKADEARKVKINEWAEENGCIVKEAHMQTILEPSPFWLVDEDDAVYRAEVVNKQDKVRIVWFRFHLFGMDTKEE